MARKVTPRGFEVVEADGDLLQVIAALGLMRGFAGGLNGRQQQCYEDSDDRDDDQELNEREAR